MQTSRAMLKRREGWRLVALSTIATLCVRAWATPQTIRVDGSVFDNTGIPSTGSKDIQIKLYSASTGGSALWTSSVYNTTVSSGRFSINLDGSTLAPYLAALATSGTAYFEVIVDTGAANGSMDTPITVAPRIRSHGTAFALTASSADALYGVTATTSELNFLSGVTSRLQTQINALNTTTATVNGKLDKGADTMTGSLGLAYANVTPNRAAYVDANRILRTDANVDSTELGYLDGVTSALDQKVNRFTANEAGYLAGVTSGLSKINAFTATEASYLAGVTSNLGAKVNLVTSSEIGYLAGVTSSLGAKVNRFTAAEAGYLAGVTENLSKTNLFTAAEASYLSGATGNLQSQISALGGGGNASDKVDRAGDSMGGSLAAAGFDTSLPSGYAIGGAQVLSLGTGLFSFNTFVGPLSGTMATGNYNSHFGTAAGAYDSGTFNTLIGVYAGSGIAAGNVMSGSNNLMAGTMAGVSTSTGSSNVFLGPSAGLSVVTASYITAVGRLASANDDAESGVAIGYSANVNAINSVQLGTGTNTTPYSLQFWGYNFLDASGNATFNSINSTISSTELGYLDGVTQALQTQMNAKMQTTSANTLTGKLGLNYTGVTVNTLLSLNGSREVTSVPVSTTEAGYLAGVTQALQTQLNAKMQTTSANTLTGKLGLNYTGVTVNTALYLNASREVTSSPTTDTELSYLSGVTSNLGAKVNRFTVNEAGFLAGVTSSLSKDNSFTATEATYLSGVTANIQTQLNSKGGSNFTISAKSGSFSATDGAGYYYRISATATVTLPASPADGSVRKFKVTGGTATFNTTSGEVINRASGTTSASGVLTLESQDGVLELIAVTGGWDET